MPPSHGHVQILASPTAFTALVGRVAIQGGMDRARGSKTLHLTEVEYSAGAQSLTTLDGAPAFSQCRIFGYRRTSSSP